MSLVNFYNIFLKSITSRQTKTLDNLLNIYITGATIYDKICRKCGKPFTTPYKHIKYCSLKCARSMERPNYIKRNRKKAMEYTNEVETTKFLKVYNSFICEKAREFCKTDDDLFTEVISTFNFNVVLFIKRLKLHNIDIFSKRIVKTWLSKKVRWTFLEVLKNRENTVPLEKVEYNLTYNESEDFDNEFREFE